MTYKEIDYLLRWCNSFNRFGTFLDNAHRCKGKKYWYYLREAYTGSDHLHQYRDELKEAFTKDEPNKYHLMTNEDHKILESLPATVTIYRGMTVSEYQNKDFGVSWTLKEKIAHFFAHVYLRNIDTVNTPMMVHSIEISKEDILAIFNDRKEMEVIYIPQYIQL